MGTYARPAALQDALICRASGADVLSGGTDYWPAHASPTSTLLDLSGIHELRTISDAGSVLRIGALATWTDIATADLGPGLRALQMAALEVGGRQIQNRGTIAGNLCNASPAADGVPPLLALDAAVELASVSGVRTIPLQDFLIGPRKTALRPDEVLTAVLIPKSGPGARSRFIKVGARKYQLISIVMAAASLDVADGKVKHAAIALGACSPVALRLTTLEADVIGKPAFGLAAIVRQSHFRESTPIDDIRADTAYRRDAAAVVVRRLLTELEAAT